ncbi:hypothetical protein C8A03DRAFT_37883 [Achaetomium macrosporum]|uniref:Uncharacterized protein n=1 Tax=Achaetomium macrosporum TaxID=79813 RepID=A0AAN7C2U3_9PEZI|nr:hypothetical protein C8A03DRAFT_37883 [Achaetomium macrosporum]
MGNPNTNPPSVPPSLRGGIAPFTATRKQSIADSVENADRFQQAFPDIDWKAKVIEPTVNLTFDLKEKVPPHTRAKHEHLIGQMIDYLASEEEGDTSKAEKAFWLARERLVAGRHEDVLRQFDAIYLQEDRPVSVMLTQLREALKLKATMTEPKDTDGGKPGGESLIAEESSA